jgi:hypothetical protein
MVHQDDDHVRLKGRPGSSKSALGKSTIQKILPDTETKKARI